MTKTKRAAFSKVKETDDTITVGSAAFDNYHRSRLDYDRLKLIDQALRACRLNPLANRIVKLYRFFAIGTNVSIEVKAKPANLWQRIFSAEKLKQTNKFIYDFWHHNINNMDEQCPEWFDERTMTGDLFILFSVDESGMTLVRAVPAESITKIDTRENDYRQETDFHTGTVEDKSYPAWDPSAIFSDADDDKDGGIKPFMRHYAINRLVGTTWGRSDLFPILPWIARYTGWLENRATLNYWRQIFVWIVTGDYKSSDERKARQKEIEANPPKPGSILVKDKSETWETESPKLDAFEANTDGLAIKKQIAAGAGFPLHFLAEPESSTRTTAEASGTPTFKNFADYQASFFNVLRDAIQIACTIRSHYDKRVMPHPEIDIHGQDITERDNANLSIAFQRAVQASGELYDRKMIDTKEMLRISYQFGGLTYDETDNQPEGLRRSLSNKVKTPNSPPPSIKADPETGDVVEEPQA